MKIGVPGEFHEDRWQQTAEDSERCVLPRIREAGRAIRIQVIAWLSVLLACLRHGDLAHKYLSAILAWQDCLEPVSNRSLADAPAGLRHGNPAHRYFRGIYAWQDHLLSTLLSRDPCPQVLQSHLPVAKQSSIGPFVHEIGPFCGYRGLDRVFLHEMGSFCGRRGPEWMLGRSFATATLPTGASVASLQTETIGKSRQCARQRRRQRLRQVCGERVRFGIERWSSYI